MEVLCKRYMSLNPLEVLNAEFSQVMDLYVNCCIHDSKNKKQEGWVTSKTATWH